MKKILLILLLFPSIAFSQSIGLKGGVTISNFKFPHKFIFPNPEYLKAPNFGIIYTHNFKKFEFTIEPTYNIKGYTQNISIPTQDGNGNILYYKNEKWKTKYSYFEIPVTFGWVPINKKIILGANIGLAPAFLITIKRVMPNDTDDISSNQHRKFNIDFIGTLKGGINIKDKTIISINFRYGNSLLGIYKSDYTQFGYYYFSSFIELGYKIRSK